MSNWQLFDYAYVAAVSALIVAVPAYWVGVWHERKRRSDATRALNVAAVTYPLNEDRCGTCNAKMHSVRCRNCDGTSKWQPRMR